MYPGLMKEPLPSGGARYRVRPKGDKTRKISLPCGPDDKRFAEYYHAARQGIAASDMAAPLPPISPKSLPAPAPIIAGSVGWLVDQYVAAMPGLDLAPGTIKQRTVFLQWLRGEVGEYSADMPRGQFVKLMDKKAHTPGAATNFLKSVRAMYEWASKRDVLVTTNPTTGVDKPRRGSGAVAWTLADLRQFREYHPPTTMPHRALTIYMFTACRISDVVHLGPGNEIDRDGVRWLDWQPAKKGSSRVTIPMLPPLQEAVRGCNGPTYLNNEWGAPYASAAAFGNAFRDWVVDAGLVDAEGKATRSSHGIRKAAGELLALNGASQYHIMAVHGHSNASTSEVYTRGAERAMLAGQAMEKLSAMPW